jgi:hypothetical protein
MVALLLKNDIFVWPTFQKRIGPAPRLNEFPILRMSPGGLGKIFDTEFSKCSVFASGHRQVTNPFGTHRSIVTVGKYLIDKAVDSGGNLIGSTHFVEDIDVCMSFPHYAGQDSCEALGGFTDFRWSLRYSVTAFDFDTLP